MKNTIRLLLIITLITVAFICSCNDTSNDAQITPATIDILKIGKADCIVINTGSKIVMIDTGEADNISDIVDYMEYNNYNKIDTLILTHYDKDHIGGAYEVISRYDVSSVIESIKQDDTVNYINYHNAMSKKGITPLKLSENYRFTYDSCQFEIDIPKQTKYAENNDNNLSLIISMKCGEKSFLFCGDAMEARLSEFISQNQASYDFMKFPYHGNYIENYVELLNSVSPKYVAITDSKKNTASAIVLATLYDRYLDVYETRYGEINVYTDGKSIQLSQKN